LTLPLSFVSSTCFALAEKVDPIKQIETDLSREQQKFQKFNLKEKNLLEQLSTIEQRVERKRNIVEEISDDLSAGKLVLHRIQEQLDRHETTLSNMQNRLGQRFVSYYKYSKRGTMQLLISAEGLDELRRRIKYLQDIMTEDYKMIRKLEEEKSKYDKKILEKKRQLKVIRSMEEEEKKELRALEEELDKKVVILSRIHQEKEFYETAVKELQLAAEEFKSTIQTIEKKKSSNKNSLPKNFSKYKGKLVLPVRGKVIRKKNPLMDERSSSNRGIYINGPLGSEVKSVFDGRVDFSGWIKGYGQVLVINHGSRFYTVLAHLMERNKEEGDRVEMGEVVGLLGQSGSLIGPSLYFELRRAGKTLDPLKWLKDH
jgi:septal ring factor EnvC (AmiA/AmiB activator)